MSASAKKRVAYSTASRTPNSTFSRIRAFESSGDRLVKASSSAYMKTG
ncbi:MAG: hypothetical protein PWQ55_172 [Chloroflexota bacterium]|nr:hypothetical protein [Chloroflexota bacterium]